MVHVGQIQVMGGPTLHPPINISLTVVCQASGANELVNPYLKL